MYIDVKEAAIKLQVSPMAIKNYIRKGLLPAEVVRIRGLVFAYRILQSDLDDFVSLHYTK